MFTKPQCQFPLLTVCFYMQQQVVGKLIDWAHVDPLHVKNNACARVHQQLLNEVIAMSKLTDEVNSFSNMPA